MIPAARGDIVDEVIQGDLAESRESRDDDDVHVGVAGGPGVARSFGSVRAGKRRDNRTGNAS